MAEKTGFFTKHTDALFDSFTNLSGANIISIFCDLGVMISWVLSVQAFTRFLALAFSDIESALLGLIAGGTLMEEGLSVIMFMLSALLSLIVLILLISVLLGYSWSRLLGKRFTFAVLFAYFKQNIIYSIFGIVSVYLINAIFADPFWQILVFFFIVVFLWLIPVFHIRLLTKKDGKTLRNMTRSFTLFRKNLHHFLVAGIVGFIVVNLITLPVLISPYSTSPLFILFMLLLGLMASSWTKSYFIEIMRLVER